MAGGRDPYNGFQAPADSFETQEYRRLLDLDAVSVAGNLYTDLDFTASNITSILTRLHNSMQSLSGGQAGEYYHLTAAQHVDSINTTTRVTGDTTLTSAHSVVFCDTDGGAITITLAAGVATKYHRIVNTGSANNLVTITPNGAELLLGANSSFTISDQEALQINYEATEGWY